MIVGIGVDIVEVGRIERALGLYGERFVRRVFTTQEAAYCRQAARPPERFATRFAAKEAALKALGTGWRKGLRLLDVQVSNDALGAPSIILTEGALTRSRDLGVTHIHVSLSHQREYAVAQVILEAEPVRHGE
jgi:holo-[acyl-carrier protein] synthase